MRYLAILGTLGVLITGGNACSGQSPTDRAAIEKAGEDYVAAFNRREAKKLAALWSPEGVYVSRSSGEQITGRAALEEEFAAIFSQEVVPQLKVATESIDFVSPNVAVERGTATVVDPEGTASDTRYRVVYVRRDGQWLIDRVTEDEVSTQVSHYQQLKGKRSGVVDWQLGRRGRRDCRGNGVQLDREPELHQPDLQSFPGRGRGVLRAADHRLGRQGQADPVLAVRLQRRFRQRQLAQAGRSLGGPVGGDPG